MLITLLCVHDMRERERERDRQRERERERDRERERPHLCTYLPILRLIRLEFNSVECQYYTELDAVELIGQKPKKGTNIHYSPEK